MVTRRFPAPIRTLYARKITGVTTSKNYSNLITVITLYANLITPNLKQLLKTIILLGYNVRIGLPEKLSQIKINMVAYMHLQVAEPTVPQPILSARKG